MKGVSFNVFQIVASILLYSIRNRIIRFNQKSLSYPTVLLTISLYSINIVIKNWLLKGLFRTLLKKAFEIIDPCCIGATFGELITGFPTIKSPYPSDNINVINARDESISLSLSLEHFVARTLCNICLF